MEKTKQKIILWSPGAVFTSLFLSSATYAAISTWKPEYMNIKEILPVAAILYILTIIAINWNIK